MRHMDMDAHGLHDLYQAFVAFDGRGDINSAFAALVECNRIKRAELSYDLSMDERIFGAVKAIYDHSPTLNSSRVPPPSTKTIFVLGMPRSGTTLVEQILDSHPDVHGAGELEIMRNICHREIMSRTDHDLLPARIQQLYLDAIGPLTSRPFLVDKMPVNFFWIGFICAAFPDARIVHVKRSPIATCWSIYRTMFRGSVPFGYDLGELVGFYKLYQSAMRFWHERLPGKIYDLSYEALTEDQEGQTRALLDCCGLTWDEACMRFHENPRRVLTASAEQVRRPMYQGSSEDWKRYEKHLGPLEKALGDCANPP